ncbi:hypothetical protein KI387_041948, partial [Taxus chinensis]
PYHAPYLQNQQNHQNHRKPYLQRQFDPKAPTPSNALVPVNMDIDEWFQPCNQPHLAANFQNAFLYISLVAQPQFKTLFMPQIDTGQQEIHVQITPEQKF